MIGSLRRLEDLEFENEKTISKMTWELSFTLRRHLLILDIGKGLGLETSNGF